MSDEHVEHRHYGHAERRDAEAIAGRPIAPAWSHAYAGASLPYKRPPAPFAGAPQHRLVRQRAYAEFNLHSGADARVETSGRHATLGHWQPGARSCPQEGEIFSEAPDHLEAGNSRGWTGASRLVNEARLFLEIAMAAKGLVDLVS